MWVYVCGLLLISGLVCAQETSTTQSANKVNAAVDNGNQGPSPITPQPQFNQLTYQNTQFSPNPNALPFTQNLNQNFLPQNQFNPLGLQNIQLGAVPQGLQYPNNQGAINPPNNFHLGALPGNFVNNGGFGGFSPLLNNPQVIPTQYAGHQLFQPSIKEIRVPQPYPVYVSKPVPVQVPVRIPVEVPKPYPVRVPHPVPVPVQIRVPVPVEKPYPVTITRTVPVPVERPVYIRVPEIVTERVPHPYPSIPQHLLPVGYQQLVNSEQIVNTGQGFPQEIQIGGRFQSTSRQLEGREGSQPLGTATVNPTPNYASNGGTSSGTNFGNSNLSLNGGRSNLLSGEARSSGDNTNGVRLNEISNDTDNRPRRLV